MDGPSQWHSRLFIPSTHKSMINYCRNQSIREQNVTTISSFKNYSMFTRTSDSTHTDRYRCSQANGLCRSPTFESRVSLEGREFHYYRTVATRFEWKTAHSGSSKTIFRSSGYDVRTSKIFELAATTMDANREYPTEQLIGCSSGSLLPWNDSSEIVKNTIYINNDFY